MTKTKTTIYAIAATTMLLMTALAVVPSSIPAYATTNRNGSTTWLDCFGSTKRGDLTVNVNTPPHGVAGFSSTNWPTSYNKADVIFPCQTMSFNKQVDSFTDHTASWTWTQNPPNTIGPNKGVNYALGHTINFGDTVSAAEQTTYKGGILTDVFTINVSAWSAT